jgi:hypothetical protein
MGTKKLEANRAGRARSARRPYEGCPRPKGESAEAVSVVR